MLTGLFGTPGAASALCIPVPNNAEVATAAKVILDGSDIVGLAVLENSPGASSEEPQRLTVIDSFKGPAGSILLEPERVARVSHFDESRFLTIIGDPGDIRLVTLKGPIDKAFVPSCIAMWAHAFPSQQLIPAIIVESGRRSVKVR